VVLDLLKQTTVVAAKRHKSLFAVFHNGDLGSSFALAELGEQVLLPLDDVGKG
jgi:hypothetical protein